MPSKLCNQQNAAVLVSEFTNEYNIRNLGNKLKVLTLRYDRTDSQVFMFRTLFSRKCGRSEFRALREEVI